MNKKSILLAVGDKVFEENLIKALEHLSPGQYSAAWYCVHREGIYQHVVNSQPDIVVINEQLNGNEEWLNIVRQLRTDADYTRIIFIAKERPVGHPFLASLVSCGVYDFLSIPSVSYDDVAALITHPNSYRDVSKYLPEYSSDNNKNSNLETLNNKSVVKDISDELDDINAVNKKEINNGNHLDKQNEDYQKQIKVGYVPFFSTNNSQILNVNNNTPIKKVINEELFETKEIIEDINKISKRDISAPSEVNKKEFDVLKEALEILKIKQKKVLDTGDIGEIHGDIRPVNMLPDDNEADKYNTEAIKREMYKLTGKKIDLPEKVEGYKLIELLKELKKTQDIIIETERKKENFPKEKINNVLNKIKEERLINKNKPLTEDKINEIKKELIGDSLEENISNNEEQSKEKYEHDEKPIEDKMTQGDKKTKENTDESEEDAEFTSEEKQVKLPSVTLPPKKDIKSKNDINQKEEKNLYNFDNFKMNFPYKNIGFIRTIPCCLHSSLNLAIALALKKFKVVLFDTNKNSPLDVFFTDNLKLKSTFLSNEVLDNIKIVKTNLKNVGNDYETELNKNTYDYVLFDATAGNGLEKVLNLTDYNFINVSSDKFIEQMFIERYLGMFNKPYGLMFDQQIKGSISIKSLIKLYSAAERYIAVKGEYGVNQICYSEGIPAMARKNIADIVDNYKDLFYYLSLEKEKEA